MALALSPAAFFAEADGLPFAALSDLVGVGSVLVVAPHPDDESLGCGGLLALCAQEGRPGHVVVVSDGTGSHPTSKRFPHDALRDLREDEARAAVAALGLESDALTFLRLPDRSVPQSGPDAESAVEALAERAHAVKAGAVLVTWRNDPHCDHEASFHLAREACRRIGSVKLLEYPVWGHTLPAETDLEHRPTGYRLDITSVLDRKRAAIGAHRSQVTRMIDDDPYGFALPPEMIARFERPFELYLESR